jgi:hypothetical protein
MNLESNKLLLEIKRKEDEERYKKDIDEKMREKKLDKEKLDKQKRIYEAEMRERFGQNWTPTNT